MKKWSVLLAALIVLGAGMVTTSFAAITVEGDVYAGVFDKYLWRGDNLSDSRPVVQGGMDLSVGNFTVSYWTNWQLKSSDDLSSGEANETDIIIDYSRDLGEMLSVSGGNIWYALDGADDTNELYLSTTVNTMLSPTVAICWDYDNAESDGLYFIFDVSHSLDLMDGLALNLGALVSYSQRSPFTNDDGEEYSGFHNYELSASLDYALTDQLSVSPSFTFSSGIDSDAKEAIDSEMLAGVNMTFVF
jgi:uncharacterized protein (TIGR02001 family)